MASRTAWCHVPHPDPFLGVQLPQEGGALRQLPQEGGALRQERMLKPGPMGLLKTKNGSPRTQC